MISVSSQSLVDQAKQTGDRNELIEASLPTVRKIARAFNRVLADDIVQEFALKFDSYFLALYDADRGQSWSTFLSQRMHYLCLDFVRRRSNHPVANYRSRTGRTVRAVSIHDSLPCEDQDRLTVADLLDRDYASEANQRRDVRALTTTLTPQARNIFEMLYADGHSQKEIADCLGMHPSRVSQIHAAGLAQLRAES